MESFHEYMAEYREQLRKGLAVFRAIDGRSFALKSEKDASAAGYRRYGTNRPGASLLMSIIISRYSTQNRGKR